MCVMHVHCYFLLLFVTPFENCDTKSVIFFHFLRAEVRQEAVQQALAQAMQNKHKPSMPMPSKRTSVMARSPDRDRHDSGKPKDDFLSGVQV